ncbi:MAG: radical SAM protein [Desulfomonilia bacterium]|jgi:putative pyruvate formate lyase activating enzyme|uniref:Radical SAM superfamily protein n=1 Tax=anaerobic digester metagenome TaxID=1263854 RepID=A0A485M1S3_9ZZZZ|nr:radical SAM protein [Pseudomonadota bacterium]HON39048.1 radical SAM protein [Deltaproteobacteria bacterium]HPD21619.1 radical SAM protein [Deltaproteobacteria bacterium]HRS56556.1 radical SAM protein [Desulfomonilia bacterium]HRV36217.1 radical SAM protein [Desulfomonilia bacterium]
MTGCSLCPRRCGIDRAVSPGACGAGEELVVGSIVIHRGEEPPLVKGAGSGAVFFSGCPLKCVYCQNRQISHEAAGKILSEEELAGYLVLLQESGCSNINLVSPTHFAPRIIHALDLAVAKGLNLPVMLNSSGYESIESLKCWAGRAHLYLMDLKYGDNEAGRMFSRVSDYWDRAREAIAHLWETVGPLRLDGEGRAVSGLIVRHLVLPGMRSNPFAVLEFLAGLSLEIPVSIMSQYNPHTYTGDMPDMKRPLLPDEYQVVLERAVDLGFSTVFVQDLDASSAYTPDFQSEVPFGDIRRIL